MKTTVSSDVFQTSLRWLLVILFFLPLLAAGAQNNNQHDVRDFINSAAKPVYKMAWPTATYREVSIDAINPVSGGYDVSVRLSGNSAWDQSDLWVDLVFLVRNWTLADVRIGQDNAFFVPAFGTLRAAGQIAAAYAKQQADQAAAAKRAQAPPPVQDAPAPSTAPLPSDNPSQAAASCIRNETRAPIVFNYHWGNDSWQQTTLKPGESLSVWFPYPGADHSSPPLAVQYADYNSQQHSFALNKVATELPVLCSKVDSYSFVEDGSSLTFVDDGQDLTP